MVGWHPFEHQVPKVNTATAAHRIVGVTIVPGLARPRWRTGHVGFGAFSAPVVECRRGAVAVVDSEDERPQAGVLQFAVAKRFIWGCFFS